MKTVFERNNSSITRRSFKLVLKVLLVLGKADTTLINAVLDMPVISVVDVARPVVLCFQIVTGGARLCYLMDSYGTSWSVSIFLSRFPTNQQRVRSYPYLLIAPAGGVKMTVTDRTSVAKMWRKYWKNFTVNLQWRVSMGCVKLTPLRDLLLNFHDNLVILEIGDDYGWKVCFFPR